MASLAHEVISGKTLSSPATLDRLQQAVQRSVVLSDGWDIMEFAEQLQKLAAGNVAFATIPVLEENGWSDDGMQSVVRVDPNQVKDWVASLLHDQDEGKTEELAYTPSKTTADVVNATDINGLAAAVSAVLTNKGFAPGPSATTKRVSCRPARCWPPRPMTLARRRFPRSWAGCRSSPTRPCRPERCGWCWVTTTPVPAQGWTAPTRRWRPPTPRPPNPPMTTPPPSPIITAGSDNPGVRQLTVTNRQRRGAGPAARPGSGRAADHLLRRRVR